MTFAHPSLLFLLIVPLAAAMWEWLRGGRQIRLPFDHGRVVHRRWLDRIIRAAAMLPYALAMVAILLVAGPQRELLGEAQREVQNVNLLLDSSMSMNGKPHDAAMDAVEAFTNRRKGDAFALTLYGNDVLNWIPLTKDLGPIRLSRPFIKPNAMPSEFGGTSTGYALSFVCDQLKRSPKGDRVVILITDGSAGDLNVEKAEAIAERLADAGIVVYTILINDQAVPPAAQLISDRTGGFLFQSGDPDAIASIFDRIDMMTPVKMRPVSRSRVDWFGPVAVSGLLLAALHTLLLFGMRFNPW